VTAADRFVERVDEFVTERPVAVIVVFLLVSVVAVRRDRGSRRARAPTSSRRTSRLSRR